MIKRIRKRDGTIVLFKAKKIEGAILKAMAALGIQNKRLARQYTAQVVANLNANIEKFEKRIPDVEQIQNIVEQVLEEKNMRLFKCYSLYRRSRHLAREIREFFKIKDDLKFSANALKVLEERYLLKDEQGKIIETPTQMFKRVAKAIAEVDKKYKENVKKSKQQFFEAMKNLEFLPNSPTLMNAGTKLGQLSACFTEDQAILSNPGFKSINEIEIGDKVVTHLGRLRSVTHKFEREIDEEIYSLKINGIFNETMKVTGEHPILAIKKEEIKCIRNCHQKCNGFIKKYCLKQQLQHRKDCDFLKNPINSPKWIKASDLRVGDYVVINSIKEEKDLKKIKISDFINKEKYVVVKGKIYKKNVDKRMGSGIISQQTIPITNDILVDNYLMLLFGYYLSEGDINGDSLRFTFSSKEIEYAKEIKKIIKDKFGLDSSISHSKAGNWLNIKVHSIILCEFFLNLFGKGFDKKDLPEWIILLPKEKQLSLLTGLFRGDGCYYKGSKQDTIFVSLSNKKLATKIWLILTRLGYNFNINCFKTKLGKPSYRISAPPSECKELVRSIRGEFVERKIFPQYLKIGEWNLRRIVKINKRKFKGKVFNLEVEEDNSYLANGVAVHNCFVLPITDSLDSIFTTLKNMAIIQQSGGGTGFSFSKLRPKSDIVRSTKGVASGPVSFIKIYDAATEVIKQGGKRRGANMAILRCDHPDVEEFIFSKQGKKQLSNFNISVAATNKFMNSVIKNKEFSLINPSKFAQKKVVRKVNAKELFDKICKAAWQSGDPGLVFIEEHNKHNPTPMIGKIESTNPCGEVGLLAYESCNLGSINISKFVKDNKISWSRLKQIIHVSVHFLDNVIDANRYPLPEIETMTKANRKIGLGIMGFADLLVKLRIPYNSTKALKLAEQIMSFISKEAKAASIKLAKVRGSFPNFKKSIYKNKMPCLRNATCTTIAPTGSISIIAGCSSGIEPLFAIAYVREIMEGKRLVEINHDFQLETIKKGFYDDKLIQKIILDGSIQKTNLPQEIKKIYVTALEIPYEWHIKMQAAFQKHVDNAVSKTINLPEQASINDIKKIYMLAWKLKCKGITVYRYGSKPEQVLYLGRGKKLTKAELHYAGGSACAECAL